MYKPTSAIQVFVNDFCFLYQRYVGILLYAACVSWSACVCSRGIVLFRPPQLSNKFEDSSVQYDEGKFSNSNIKKFIQDNM